MFGNFLYFIIVLLIYITYQPLIETRFSALETAALFFCLIFAFFYFNTFIFRKLEKRIAVINYTRLDSRFHALLMRQSIMAVLIFAINIYVLNLPLFLNNIPIFRTIPTLEALLFMTLFVGYLALVWACSYGAYRKLYRSDISRKTYVLSNISFSVPVLLPWLVLSGFADLIKALPFEWPARFLDTPEGEIVYFLLFLFVLALLAPKMIQKFWRCKPLEAGGHRTRIENLCRKAGIACADILSWPIFGGKMITAGVMGLFKKFRYILVTPSLLRLLEPEEIDAVIAHEIGHVKKKHLIFYLLFFIGYMLLSYVIGDMVQWWLISSDLFYWFVNKTGFDQLNLRSIVYIAVIIVTLVIYFRFIFGFYMRNFEREADIFVYTLFDSAKPLISTLEKIVTSSGQPADRPNWHHFSIKERIEYLDKCESDRKWITAHHRKVKRSIGIFLVGMFLIGAAGYQLNYGAIGDRLTQNYYSEQKKRLEEKEKRIAEKLAASPDDPDLYRQLGDLYYNLEDYPGVMAAYEKSLALRLKDAHVLNSLAWFYATCADTSLRNPGRSLLLAKLAIELDQSAHVYDTLAESYFINGMTAEAVRAGKQALKRAKRDHVYYRKQLERFKKATSR